jgi:hypothetical protein
LLTTVSAVYVTPVDVDVLTSTLFSYLKDLDSRSARGGEGGVAALTAEGA